MENRALLCPNCARVMVLAKIVNRETAPKLLVYECQVCRLYIHEAMDEGAEKRTLQ